MSTSNTKTNFTAGQVVKHITSRRREKTIVPAKVTKVWKNGIVQIADYATGRPYSCTFGPDGSIRGSRSYSHSHRIEPLAEGETPEGLLLEIERKAQAARDAEDLAKQEKASRIAQWWEAEGKAMWEARIRLPEFLGEEVSVIRFTRHGEEHMPFVIVGREHEGRGPMFAVRRVRIKTGGLSGRIYKDGEGQTHRSTSTYSSSDACGDSFEEALYEVTH